MSYHGPRGVDRSDNNGGFQADRRSWRGGGGAGRSHPYRREDGPGGPRDFHPNDRPPFQGRGGYRGGGGGGGYRGGYQRGGGHHSYPGPPPPSHLPPPSAVAPVEKIDRSKVCPLLLRVYIQKDRHHAAEQFAVRGEEPNEDSIIIYTWMDATLRELADLIQLVNEDARRPNTEISFAFVYPDRSGKNVIKHVQTIQSYKNKKSPSAAADKMNSTKTLSQLKFETGDFLSVALLG